MAKKNKRPLENGDEITLGNVNYLVIGIDPLDETRVYCIDPIHKDVCVFPVEAFVKN